MKSWLLILALFLGASAISASPAFAQRLLADGIQDLAQQISTSATKSQKRKVAIVPFRELRGQPTVLGVYLSEELTTKLFQIGALDVVERTLIDKILAELKLQSTGVIDPDTARKIGQIAGVEAIVTGTITDFPSSAAVNCRLIDVQTGRLIAAAQVELVKDDKLKSMLLQSLGEGGSASSPAKSPPSADSPARAAGHIVSQLQFDFDFVGCEAVDALPSTALGAVPGSGVVCRVIVTNTARSPRNFVAVGSGVYGAPPTRVLTRDGEHVAAGIRMADQSGTSARLSLAPGSPTQILIVLGNIPDSTTQFDAIEVSGQTYPGGINDYVSINERQPIRAVFRNVSIARK